MKKLIVIAAVLALAAGCQNTKTMSASREESQKRWFQARAQVLCGLAGEYLKSGQLDKASSNVKEALSMDPDYVPGLLLGARITIEQGNYPSAIAQLTKICEKATKNAEARYLLAVAQEKNDDLEQALANYRQAYELNNSSVAPMMAAAEVLILLNRPQEAQELFAPHVSKAESDPAVCELAGRLAMMTQNYARATECFQQAHDLDFQNVRYLESLADAQYQARQHARAAETYSDLIALKDYKATATTYCRLGDCQIATGNAGHAFNAYSKATDLAPNAAGAWTKLAEAALALRDEDRAIVSARAALELEPGNVQASLTLGYAMIRSGKAAQALTALEQAAADHPDVAMLQVVLGRAYETSGQKAKATQCYQQALKIDEHNKLAQSLLATALKDVSAPNEATQSTVN